MGIDTTQRDFWDRAAATKTFTHPLDLALLARHVGADPALLDYGCGQGRLCGALQAAGYRDPIGVDISPAMIARARAALPGLRFDLLEPAGLQLPDTSLDGVLLFAVLTCVPSDASQQALVADLARVLRPGGIVYLSDYLLQDDTRSIERYRRHAPDFARYGCFVTDDGAVVRHHTREWLATLFREFEVEHAAERAVTTMNGHHSLCCQRILRKKA